MSDFLERIQSLSPKRLALLADELQSQLTSIEQAHTEPIALVGIGCRFPGKVTDPDTYWQLLRSGKDPITEVPPERWDVDAYYDPDPSTPGRTYTRRGGFLTGVDQFDPDFFGISPREAVHMDPQQRMLLEVSWEALERSGHAPKSLVGSRTAVYVAIGTNDYANLQTRAGDLSGIDAYSGSGNGFCFAAGRISYALGLQGPNMALDAACASSLMAVHLACQSLRARECELALVGGVNLMLSPETNVAFSRTRVMATDGRCKTFDAAADGYVRSEGCAAVVLKRLSQAVENRDPILAVIRGSAMNHGGASGGLTIPNGSAQQTAIREALSQAKIQPQNIQYVETQGTGTPLGDAIEVRALGAVLKQGRSPQQPLWLASVKTNIGHTETASGLASLIKVVLALQHQKLPPHLHLQQVNPEISLEDIPAKIPTTLVPWPEGQSRRLAGVNAFGMSGTNAHVILEAAPTLDRSHPAIERPLHAFPVSAKTPEALRQLVQRYASYLAHTDVPLGDVCFTAAVGRSHFPHRLMFVSDRAADLQQQLTEYLSRSDSASALAAPPGQKLPKIIFDITGRDDTVASSSGSSRQLYDTQPVFKGAIDRCAESLAKTGISLLQMLYPETGSSASDGSPYALFAINYALAELWQSWGIKPAAGFAGGGEGVPQLIADCVSGKQDLEAALQIVSAFPQSKLSPLPLTPPEAQPPTEEYRLSLNSQHANWKTLLTHLSRLYQQGAVIDWQEFHRPYAQQRLELPTYPFQRQRYWSELAERGAQPTPLASVASAPSRRVLSREALLAIDLAQRQQRLAAHLCECIADALGVASSDITPEVSLDSLALDSIMALELKFDFEKTLCSNLPITSLLKSQDIATLSAEILENFSNDILSTELGAALPQLTPDPDNRHHAFPLNDIQEAYWLGRSGLFEIGNVAAHVYAEFETEDLDCDRLNDALQHLINRHDMLRAVILPDGKQQILESVLPYNMEILDLRQALPDEVANQLSALRQRLSHQIHDAHQWPLFTICVARLAEERVRIYLSFDNLLVDGASLGLLCWEWGQIYQGLGASLAPLSASFRDYIFALKTFEQSAVYQRSLAYWQARLPELPRAPDLPLAIAPASLQQPRFIRRTAQIEPAAWQRLQQQAARVGLTPSGLLVATYAEVLATWSKTRHFSLNLTTFNRLPIHPDVQNIVGDFTSLTLLAVDYRDPDSFWTRAKQLQTQLWQDLEHSYVSGVRVLRELARASESAARVTMPVVFTSLLANPQIKGRSAFSTDWLGQLVYGIAQTPQVWLDHQVYEEAGALMLNWDYVQALFPEGMADAMFDIYVQGLKTLADQPETGEQNRFLQLPSWQRDLQIDFNATGIDTSQACLQTLFLTQARRQPQHPAVVSEAKTLTYAELQQQSQQLSQQLRALGVMPHQLVAIAMDKGWEQVVAVLGVLMAGAAYVPIDPALPEERRWYLLEQSLAPGQQAIVLTQSWLLDTVKWPSQVQLLLVDAASLLPVLEPIEPPTQPTDLAYVIYTSGSTGMPKGVMIDHQGAVNTILDINRRWNVGASDRVFALSALNFDLSVYDIFGTLAAGATIVMPPAAAAKEPALWAEVLQREQVTFWNSVPAFMQMLVTHAAGRSGVVPQSLRLVLLSGDWLPLTLPDQIRDLVPEAQVVSLGGATEASIWSIFYPIDMVDPAWKSIPYGRPLANQQFYVLDANLEPCPVWVPGQLHIGGLGLAQGYWRDEVKTAASFITHPNLGTLYRTGDMGRFLPNGQVEFLGREDNQVKVSGYRIELGEVESTLTRHPDISQAVVLAAGEPAQQLVAHVCLEDGLEPPNHELPNHAQATPLSATATTAGVVSYQREPADGAVRWQNLVSETITQAEQIIEPVDRESFQRLWQHLHDLYVVAAGMALRQIGGFTQPGDRQSLEVIQQQSQIHPRYQPWLKRALTYLSEEGYLHYEVGEYVQRLSLPEKLPTELARQISTEAPQAIGLNVEATSLLINSVERIADILTENFHSAEIYTAEEVPEIYQKQFYTSNLVMQRAMAALFQHWKLEGPLRILEVGAGIGSTTTQILPMLPGDRTTYVYTDISNYFLQYAQQNFGAYPFLETRLLNIEQHPQSQGCELHSFDVVVAVSVLHATRDIAETLSHIALLLKPGGILLMLEETKFYAPFDLTMGLQQGFDRFEDTGLRQHHPLLSRDEWRQSILDAGFSDFQVLAQPRTIADQLGFDVLMARGSATIRSFSDQALKTYLEQKLPTYMIPQDYVVLDTIPLTSNGKVDRRSLQTLWQVKSPTTSEYVAPQNAIQEILVAMWQELLNCDRVGIHDNFFALGGDSLIAAQVMTQVRENFQVEVSLRQLFQEPTVAQLAAAIAQALAEQVDPELLKDLETI